MAKKVGLMGLDRLTLFPIKEDTNTAYSVDAGISVPWIQGLTKSADVSQAAIYGDDTKYMDVVNFNGLTVNITLAEMSLELRAALGFGEFDEATNTLKWDPQGKNKEFGATFRCLQADGSYRMYRYFRFIITSVDEADSATKGDSANIQPYTIVGTFAKRSYDNLLAEIHDMTEGEDSYTWLASIPSMPASGSDDE